MSSSRVGELTIGRAAIPRRGERFKVDLAPLTLDPDEAGLIGSAHLVPRAILQGFNALLAVDIGGTNLRCGIVRFKASEKAQVQAAGVWKSELWPHRKHRPTRDEMIAHVTEILRRFEKLAPVIGGHDTMVVLHNDAVARGLSYPPKMRDVRAWGVLTIGTGLDNASFETDD